MGIVDHLDEMNKSMVKVNMATSWNEEPHIHAYKWLVGPAALPITLKMCSPYEGNTMEFKLTRYGINLTLATFDEETEKWLKKAMTIFADGLDKKYLTGWVGPGKPDWLNEEESPF